jgi:regulation of enolase protein 1 (concanavalin A-like superfamily)
MARADASSAGASYAAVLATPGENGYRFQSRPTTDGTTISGGSAAVNYPNTWLRLSRAGDVFTGYSSTDGQTWAFVGEREIAMGATVSFGMAVTSHDATATTTAAFRDLGDTGPITPEPTAPSAPASLTADATSPSDVDLVWSAASGATSYRVERKGPGEAAFSEIAANVTATSFTDTNLFAGNVYVYRVRAANAVGLSPYGPTSSTRTLTFASSDVGGATPAGSTTVVAEASAYDVVAGGRDINGTADSFRFLAQRRTGDFDVKVRLQSLDPSHAWAKAGLMAREDLSAGSRMVFTFATPNVNGYGQIYRGTAGGGTISKSAATTVAYPNGWLRLRRVGDVFTGYRSTDGVNWTVISTVNLALSPTVYFGLAVSSHNEAATTTARFRDLGAA